MHTCMRVHTHTHACTHTHTHSMCGADKERLKISIYGGLSLKGEVLVSKTQLGTHPFT